MLCSPSASVLLWPAQTHLMYVIQTSSSEDKHTAGPVTGAEEHVYSSDIWSFKHTDVVYGTVP